MINRTVEEMFNKYDLEAYGHNSADVEFAIKRLLRKIGPKSRFNGRLQLPPKLKAFDNETTILDENVLWDFAYGIVQL